MPLINLIGISVREVFSGLSAMWNERGLKIRIRIVASGKLVNHSDKAWVLNASTYFITSAVGSIFSLGCIHALNCNKNKFPTGIMNHDLCLTTLAVFPFRWKLAQTLQSPRANVTLF